MADRLITLRDGRQLGLTSHGDPAAARVVLFCHPAPGAGGFDPDPPVTGSWGVHVVSFDRPGYGASTPLPDAVRPSITGSADDLAEYVDRLMEQARQSSRTSIHKVGVVGWSAGGRVALALAARHPGLVDRVALVATPAPHSAVPWIPADLQRMNEEIVGLPVPDAKARLREALRSRVPGMDLISQEDVDHTLIEHPGLRGRVERMLQHADEQGTVGLADDILASASDDWGFEFDGVRAPVLLVYGAKDPVVPSAHGRWYRRALRNAQPRLTVVPRAGHLVIAPAWRRILEHVDPQQGIPSGA